MCVRARRLTGPVCRRSRLGKMKPVCGWCGLHLTDNAQYLKHILDVHSPRPGGGHEGSPHTSTPHSEASSSNHVVPSSVLECNVCMRVFAHKRTLTRHVREVHGPKHGSKCSQCGRECKNQRTLLQHVRNVHARKKFACKHCQLKFTHARQLRAHHQLKRCAVANAMRRFKCRQCRRGFTTLTALYTHKRRSHNSTQLRHECPACHRGFHSLITLMMHKRGCLAVAEKQMRQHVSRRRLHRGKTGEVVGGDGQAAPPASPASPSQWETRSAVDGLARIHLLTIHDENDLQLTLIQNLDSIQTILEQDMTELRRVKWYMVAWVRVNKTAEGIAQDDGIRYLRCPVMSALLPDDLPAQVRQGITGVINSFDTATDEGSSILFERVEKIELFVAKLSLLRGSSYLALPEWLRKPSKGLINIQNEDEKCFMYAVLAGVDLPKHNPERVSKYRHRLEELDMTGIKYPVSLKSISQFEAQNVTISVSVFGLEEGQVVPLRISRVLNREKHVNLLLLIDSEVDGVNHYVLIRDLSRFLGHTIKRNKRQYWCDNCLNPQDTAAALATHRQRCIEQKAQAIVMPTAPHNIMKFTEYEKQMRHDYVIYCDLESVLEPISTVLPNPERSSTTRATRHVPCGYCFVVRGPDGYEPPVLEHGGADIMLRFLRRIRKEASRIKRLRGPEYVIDMTEASEAAFLAATHCYLCKKEFSKTKQLKCRDHDHAILKDNFRGAACQGCNLNLKRRDYIPCFFHNLSNYDCHHIISAIGQVSDGEDLSCIPRNKEKYISFSWGKLRFLDSMNFLSSSLDKLVKDLQPGEMEALRLFFPDEEKRALVSRKGVYPYSHFDSFKRFEETQLPPMIAFKNDLTGESIREEDYEHAQKVFEVFNMDSLWDYHDLYLMTDTLLLCCVMEAYRNCTFSCFNLDPVHYYTTPGLAWSAALLYTQQELQLLDDIDLLLFFEAGIRGGVCSVNKRSAYANNPLVPESYDSTKESCHLLYTDANNLYGLALSGPLPIGEFRFLSAEEVAEFDVSTVNEDDEYGYLCEVSLEYGDHLHDLHNDFPVAPERVSVPYRLLSPLQKRLNSVYELPENPGIPKLIPNLCDKENYTVYGSTLKLYVELGLVVKQIHRVATFRQKAWLAKYIDHNTAQRQKATSSFQKNLWKLKNNSCFGKAIEQVRRRRDVVFTKKGEKFRKCVRSPLFHSFEIFDHGLISVERKKARIVLNKPVYAGQVVLDSSKSTMYKFHFGVMKPRYGDKIKVCCTDTDSVIYEIRTPDLYADLAELGECFDFSDYPKEHPLFSEKFKKVPGYFKDELNGVPMKSFIGLRPKMYAFERGGTGEKCVGKGIPRAALKSQLTFRDYEHCLSEKSVKYVNFSKIGTDRKHHLYTTVSTKRGLSCYDDKRYLLGNNIDTLAYGHYRIRNGQYEDEGAENLEELLSLMDL